MLSLSPSFFDGQTGSKARCQSVCLLMRGETAARKFAHKKAEGLFLPQHNARKKHIIKESPSSKTRTTRKVHAVKCVGDLSFHSLLFGRFPRNNFFC